MQPFNSHRSSNYDDSSTDDTQMLQVGPHGKVTEGPDRFDPEYGPPVMRDRRKVEKIEWDPFFGPPVRKGEGGNQKWKEYAGKDIRSTQSPVRQPAAAQGLLNQEQESAAQRHQVQAHQAQNAHVVGQQQTAAYVAQQQAEMAAAGFAPQQQQPPQVDVTQLTPEQRLARLDQAKAEGKVTEEEYQHHRSVIMSGQTPQQQPTETQPPPVPQQQQVQRLEEPSVDVTKLPPEQRLARLEQARAEGKVSEQEFNYYRNAILSSAPHLQPKPHGVLEVPTPAPQQQQPQVDVTQLTPEQRLARLDQAKAEGKVTEEEYQHHRSVIMSSAGHADPLVEVASNTSTSHTLLDGQLPVTREDSLILAAGPVTPRETRTQPLTGLPGAVHQQHQQQHQQARFSDEAATPPPKRTVSKITDEDRDQLL